MNFQTYPIYSFHIRWVQDGNKENFPAKWNKGTRKSRVKNSTSFYDMYKESQSDQQLTDYLKQWWKDYKQYHLQDIINPSRPTFQHKYLLNSTWCFSWFSHWTFDVGQTDQEAIDSFFEHLRIVEKFNLDNGHFYENERNEQSEKPYICLMGADEIWRWRNPCRCDSCKRFGIIRIDH